MDTQVSLRTETHTPGHQLYTGWDVIAFLYDHYKSEGTKNRLYTTRSPYWAQKLIPTGMDVNLSKINKIWAILDDWSSKITPVKIESWDTWKSGFKIEDMDKPDNLKIDTNYTPDQDIRNAAIDAEFLDKCGKAAEDELLAQFIHRFIEVCIFLLARTLLPTNSYQLAKKNPTKAFAGMKKNPLPTKMEEGMFTSGEWRDIFSRWKYTEIHEYVSK